MSQSIRILIVDDEAHVCASLEGWFLEEGYDVSTAKSGLEALEVAVREEPQILLVDIKMPVMDGLTFQRRLLELLPDATVIMMTAFGSVDTAVQALKEGAHDYILKPFDPEHLSRLVSKAAERYSSPARSQSLEARIQAATPRVIAPEGGAMSRILARVEDVAPTETSVLLQGESGTGKRLLAHLIHARSARHFGPMVTLDCGASTPDALGCALFGRGNGERGRGGVELAQKGTLYLGAVDRMPAEVQAEVLEVLEAQQEARGLESSTAPDFRLVCATERDLEREVSEGRFRRDLFLHLSVFQITLPPLRDRPDDIPHLVAHFVRQNAQNSDRKISGVTEAALERLVRQPWPGNVRELQKVIEGAWIASEAAKIGLEDLRLGDAKEAPDLRLSAAEARHIRRVLLICEHDPARAAAEMGLDEAGLLQKMKHHDIRRR